MRLGHLVLIICGYLSAKTEAYSNDEAAKDYIRLEIALHGTSVNKELVFEVYELPFFFPLINCFIAGGVFLSVAVLANFVAASFAIYASYRPLSRKPTDDEIAYYLEDEPVYINLHPPRPTEFRMGTHVHHDKETVALPPDSSMGDVSQSTSAMTSELSEYANKVNNIQVFDPRFPTIRNKRVKTINQQKNRK